MTRICVIGLFALSLALPLGCSRDETKDAVAAAGEKVEQAAEKAADKMEATAENAAGSAAAAVGAGPDPAVRCRDLAAANDWKAALAPCTTAHEQNPDDKAIGFKPGDFRGIVSVRVPLR